ncbi:hypothetical protein TNCV_2341311 [Trichonephila clavipes]|nr:hypothetical protein TNCV_2341311 [Trichonephila clavipes]
MSPLPERRKEYTLRTPNFLGYLLTTEKMPHRRIRAHYEQLSEFERGRIIRLKEAGWTNRRIAHHMDRMMRPLEDTGKNGWTVAHFSYMIVAVDLRL